MFEEVQSITYGEIFEFIGENKWVFTILERDLNTIAAENERVTSQKKLYNRERGNKSKIKKPMFVKSYEEDASITKELITFNGLERLKNMNEVFYDFLLNHFNTVRNGGEFKLTYGYIFDNVGNLRLYTREDTLIYLSTLFCIVFNYRFMQSIDLDSFQRFLMDNDLVILTIEKGKMDSINTNTMTITQRGKSEYGVRSDEIRKLKKYHYIHADQMMSDFARERKTRIVGGKYYPPRETAYNTLSGDNVFEEVFPKSLQNALNTLLERNTTVRLPSNINNDFALEAILAGMDKTMSRVFYRGFKKNILDSEENKNLEEDERMFIIMYLIVRKYGYKKVSSLKYIDKRDLNKLSDVDLLDKTRYYKILDLDKDFLSAYISKHLGADMYGTSFVLALSFSFVILSKVKGKTLEYILGETKNDFLGFVQWKLKFGLGTEEYVRLSDMYNKGDIENKVFFKEMKKQLTMYYYKQKSNEYKTFPMSMRKEIAKDFLRNTVLMETSLKYYWGRAPEEEMSPNDKYSRIMKEISEIFSIEF